MELAKEKKNSLRIGLIVDGQAEFRALPQLLPRIKTSCTVLHPLYADIQPLAKPAQIVRAMKGRLRLLAAKNIQRAIILIDKENRTDCTGDWARILEIGLCQEYCDLPILDYKVVIKDSKFENWLVSDTEVLASMTRRFKVSNKDTARIGPNKADRIDAHGLMGKLTIGGCYDKIEDAVRILNAADPMRMAYNSRSFRRFLRVLETPRYIQQSKNP